jgi:hypothetical protein
MLPKELKITMIVLIATLMILIGLVLTIGGINNERFYGFYGLAMVVAGFKLLSRLK